MAENQIIRADVEAQATDAQKRLLKELVDELAYPWDSASDIIANASTKEKAAKMIDELLEEKRTLKAKDLLPGKVQSFDKICFAMVWKQVEGFWLSNPAFRPTTEAGQQLALTEKYKQFRAAQEACKKSVAEGGQQ